jgi:hypothetical protein
VRTRCAPNWHSMVVPSNSVPQFLEKALSVMGIFRQLKATPLRTAQAQLFESVHESCDFPQTLLAVKQGSHLFHDHVAGQPRA